MTYRIKTTVAAPGANGNTTTFFDSTTRPGVIESGGYKYYVVSLKTAALGTLNAYASGDAGSSWHQFASRHIPATESAVMRHVPLRIDQHADIKVEWVNGGSAQSTWYIAQALTDDMTFPFDHGHDNPTYVVNQTMVHSVDFRGPAIQVGPDGSLLMHIQWASTSSPVGTLSLVHTLDGTTWRDVPGAAAQFTTQPNSNTGNLVCYWRKLRPFKRVALRYVSTSGGAANALQAQTTTW